MNNLIYCINCGEEIDEIKLFKSYLNNPKICSICDREQFEDIIGYENG